MQLSNNFIIMDRDPRHTVTIRTSAAEKAPINQASRAPRPIYGADLLACNFRYRKLQKIRRAKISRLIGSMIVSQDHWCLRI